jgi:hypothetical protein
MSKQAHKSKLLDMSREEFDVAMKGLIAKGIAEEFTDENGDTSYRLTDSGKVLGAHLFMSDGDTRH